MRSICNDAGHLGVPVVEAVTDGQRGVIAGQLEPIPVMRDGGQDGLEVSVGIDVEVVDQVVGNRDDSIHCLQADVLGGAPTAEDAVCLASAERRERVGAVRVLQTPRHDVVHAAAPNSENRVGISPQCLVDAHGKQNKEMPQSRRIVDSVAVERG
jgi:hypothetical protein